MRKEVFIRIAKHPERGGSLVLGDMADLVRDTNTKEEDWESREGWVEIETARRIYAIEEAILAGRLKIREVDE